jgi:tetratricopeptide (TPR) repeat protein
MLLVMQSALHGQGVDALMRKGDDALASGLWEMAALHYNDCLASRNLSAADKSSVAIRLAEAWIRDGKPAEALALLGQSFVSQNPAVPFWKGQALAGLGRFAEAISSFTPLLNDPAAPYRNEAGFTMASLQLALDQPQAALTTLATLSHTPDEALNTKAQLRQVEILLDLGRPTEARETMPAATSIRPGERPLATFLEAHLRLTEGHPADAVASFQTLIDQPQGQSLYRHHSAAVGLADALRASETPEAVSKFLLTFIQDHPDSPLLDDLFKRLGAGLPDTPELTDPILERLAQWITPSELTATGAINTLESNAAAAWPSTTTSNELLAFALFTRAVGLHRIPTAEARAEARRLLTRLRLEYPSHVLASRALFLTACWALEQGASGHAFSMLDTLRETAKSAMMRGKAAFLEARTADSQGDKDQAIRLFDEAAKSLAANEAQTARFNAAILRLGGAPGTATPVLQADLQLDPALVAELELERALSLKTPVTAKAAIEAFLTGYPDHPRAAEARLALAEAALAGPQPDLAFVRTQLDTLVASPEKSANVSASRIALLKLQIDDLSKNSTAAIATAKSIMEQYPEEPAAAEAAFVLGRNLFQTRNYNDARLVLEKLAASDTDPGRAQAAGLLAARSAALVPTSQSQQEALILFDKVIAAKGSVAAIAMLEKSRLMIDMNRLTEVAAFLRKWFDSLPKTDPLHLPAGLLLGEAVYAQGSVNPNSLTEALAVYDQLLVHADKQPAVFNRLQYLRGRTLEQIPDAKDPTLKREKQAFIAYYSVLEITTAPAEWHYFELCGFRALSLLEKVGRWPAAIACAKKIASFKGPRAEEASTRAGQLQLKHMIWED